QLRKVRRTACRPACEQLEDRATPANIAVLGTTLQPATAVRLTYQSAGVSSFNVGVYRSADGVLGTDDVRITTATVTPGAASGSPGRCGPPPTRSARGRPTWWTSSSSGTAAGEPW